MTSRVKFKALTMDLTYLMLPLCIALSGGKAFGQSDLGGLSLEQLMSVEVTTATNRQEVLENMAAATFVISAEDIRRSGVASVAEALRMVPGIHVARIDDTRWAVSARGFNDQFSNKLSVTIDGRHLNSPNNFGVFWDDHMPLIDNVERIEVTRGPGGGMQGLNAVNGSINIVSRSARETQGLLVQGRLGSFDINGITARYGNVTENGWYYRFDYHSVDENVTDSPIDTGNFDNLSQQKVSFRLDRPKRNGLLATIEGAYYQSDSREVTRQILFDGGKPFIGLQQGEIDAGGGWLKGDLVYESESSDSIRATAYWEDTERDYSFAKLGQRIFSLDVKGQHSIGDRHELNWGLEAYFAKLPLEERSGLLSTSGMNTDYHIYRLQFQDEIKLNEKGSVFFGSRIEKNQYIDWTVQPNIRFSWKHSEGMMFWAAISSALRMPSFSEVEHLISPIILIPEFSAVNPSPLPVIIETRTNNNFHEESLVAYEAGVKLKLTDKLNLELSAFEYDYDDLLSGGQSTATCSPSGINVIENPSCLFFNDYLTVTGEIESELAASSSGIEATLSWQPLPSWRISSSVSVFDFDFNLSDPEQGPNFASIVSGISEVGTESEPEWIAYFRSEWNINDKFDVDVSYRAVASSDTFNIDSYNTIDLRLEWRPRPSLRVEFVGQNLVNSGHVEFGTRSSDALPSRINKAVFARISWAP